MPTHWRFAMFLTIVLVPVMYYTVDLVKEKMEKWFGEKIVSEHTDSGKEMVIS